MTEHSFLVLIQKCHRLNSVLKIPVANVFRLITPQLILGMAGVCPPKVWIVYGLWLWVQLLLNQSPKCYWNYVWSF